MINKLIKMIMGMTILFIVLPFLFLIKEGGNQLLSWPYSNELIFAIKNSLFTGLISTSICLVLTFFTSLGLRNSKNKGIYNFLVRIPLSTPHVVAGICLLFFFGQKALGKYLNYINIDFIYTVEGIILAQLFVNLPYAIQFMNSSMEKISDRKLFVARSLGCSSSQVINHIIIPSLKNDLLGLFIITFSRAIGEFGAIMMLVGVSSLKTETLATSVFMNMSTGDFDKASAAALMLLLISIAANFLYKLLERKKS